MGILWQRHNLLKAQSGCRISVIAVRMMNKSQTFIDFCSCWTVCIDCNTQSFKGVNNLLFEDHGERQGGLFRNRGNNGGVSEFVGD